MKREAIVEIVEKHQGQLGGMIAMLEEVQADCGYLPEASIRTVAEVTGRPLVEVYGVATFYKAFSLKPKGRHIIAICLGTACHVRGADEVVKAFERTLNIQAGDTTEDGEFTLETVNCLGACALGPIVAVDGHYFPKVRPTDVQDILNSVGVEKPAPAFANAETHS